MSKKYINILIITTAFILAIVSTINYYVDPENIYSQITLDNNLKKASEEISGSKYGILSSSINKRDLKKALAIYSKNVDCAIIGNSHHEAIGTFREKKSLSSHCNSIVNLSVSSSSLEDYFAFSNMLLENNHSVNSIVFGISPHSLNLNWTNGWRRNKNHYDSMIKKLGYDFSKNKNYFDSHVTKIDYEDLHQDELQAKNQEKLKSKNDYKISLILNLFNLEYLIESFNQIIFEHKTKKTKDNDFKLTHVEMLDIDLGLAGLEVTLPDGTHLDKREYIVKYENLNAKFDGILKYDLEKKVNWYFDEEITQPQNGVEEFMDLINFLKFKFNIIFVLTPYHPKVWEVDQISIEALKISERKINELARKLNIKVLGSYDPVNIDCSIDEFNDPSHISPACAEKLERKTTLNLKKIN